MTVEHTSYKMRLTVASGSRNGDPTAAWTCFQVLVKEIKLELGPKKMLPAAPASGADLHGIVYDDNDAAALNGALPAVGARKKVFLTSNIFSLNCPEQFVNTDFTLYESMWADGPQIPVVALIKVRSSIDTAVDAPKALGNVRMLWDAEEVDESAGSVHAAHHATAKTFLEQAVAFKKSSTKPKGDNCHKDRGGKRGDTAKTCFALSPGYAPQDELKDRGGSPFKVEACSVRQWAVYSRPWTKGKMAGKTGVLFQPSRMAGDAYRLSCYLAYDKAADGKVVLDVDVDAPLKVHADIRQSTGTFEIWRRVNFIKYLRKTSTVVPAFPMAAFQGYYEQAYLQMKDTSGGAVDMVKAEYNSKVAAAVATLDWYMRLMISSANQYDAGNHGVEFIGFTAWKAAVKANKGWTNAELNAFLGTVLNTTAKYNAYCSGVATTILTHVGTSYMSASAGVNLFHFNEHYNLATLPGGKSLNGFAPGTAVARDRCMFVLCAGPTNYGGNSNRAEQTVAHEIGHCLLLAHSTDGVSATDACNIADAPAHDTAWANCTMSYNYTAERKFCGLCLLRLRGWNRDGLSKTAASNTSP